jgi:hypothetical protein
LSTWFDWVVRGFIAYLAVSCATLPFLNRVWFGEIPLLALVQLPKTGPAQWLRTEMVMPAIRALGWSRGSFSPDFLLARPYALGLAYGLFLSAILLAALWGRRGRFHAGRVGLLILLGLAAVDFAMLLYFGGGPGLSIY